MRDPETDALLKLVGWCAVIIGAFVLLFWQVIVMAGIALQTADNPDARLPGWVLPLVVATYVAAPIAWAIGTYAMARSMRVFLWLSPFVVLMAVAITYGILVFRSVPS